MNVYTLWLPSSQNTMNLWTGSTDPATVQINANTMSGIKLGTRMTAVTLAAADRAGMYTTAGDGSAPFDAWGNLIIKPDDQAGRTVEVWTGSTPAQRFVVSDAIIDASLPIRFLDGADLIYDVHNVTADLVAFETSGLHIISSNTGTISGALSAGTDIGQRAKFVCKAAGNNIDIVVSHHVTSDPEVIRLDAAREWVELVWDGTDWVETGGSGQTYP